MNRKFKVMATLTDEYESWKDSALFVAEDEDEAVEKFMEFVHYADSVVDVDDITIQDLGPVNVYIHSRRNSYSPDMKTMTVGDLIEILSQYNPDSKVYTKDGDAFCDVFGSIDEFAIEEEADDTIREA